MTSFTVPTNRHGKWWAQQSLETEPDNSGLPLPPPQPATGCAAMYDFSPAQHMNDSAAGDRTSSMKPGVEVDGILARFPRINEVHSTSASR